MMLILGGIVVVILIIIIGKFHDVIVSVSCEIAVVWFAVGALRFMCVPSPLFCLLA